MILPFSFHWDADLVTRGDTDVGTAGGGELILFFNIGVSGVAPSTISALTRLRVGTAATFVCVSTMNKDLRVSYKHTLAKVFYLLCFRVKFSFMLQDENCLKVECCFVVI